jgi:hypothetical protein
MQGRQALLTGLEKTFGDALFSIPEIGTISPPIRTKWGWDVILWTEVLPAETLTRDELAAKRFPEERLQAFDAWVARVAKDLGLKVVRDDKPLEQYERAR